MRLEVETGVYRSAMDLCYDGGRDLTDSVVTLSGVLQGCAAMAGQDHGGREWADSYDGVADDLIRAGADLAGSLGVIGDLLNASLVNHEGADEGARLGVGLANDPAGTAGSGATSGAGDSAGDVAGRACAPLQGSLPSAAGGTGGPPPGWPWLVDYLQGYLWPDADTAAMRSAGAAWQRGAGGLTQTGYSVQAARVGVESQQSPEVGPAAAVCAQLQRHCDELGTAYADIGRACSDYADQVDEHHHELIKTVEELMAWTVIDQVTGAVLSFFTAGAAEVAAQLAESGIMATYAARVIALLRSLIELAVAAARLISSAFAKVIEIVAKLKRLLNARALAAFDRFATAELRRSRAETRRLLELSEDGAGHTREVHIGLSDRALAHRIESAHVGTASSFTDRATAVRQIDRVLTKRADAIENWLSGSKSRLTFDEGAGSVIGRTSTLGGEARDATGIRVVLSRDDDSPLGYIVLTSFPQ